MLNAYALPAYRRAGTVIDMKSATQLREHHTHDSIAFVAERLFAEVGFEKTTVSDIARQMHMSPANVYRFYGAKSEINQEVARKLLAEIEAEVAAIAKGEAAPDQKLRAVIATIEASHASRFAGHRKLHELLETAFNENWPIAPAHVAKIDAWIAAILAEGARAGLFRRADYDLAAMIVRNACMRFCHPRVMVECAEQPEPTLDQVVDFCIAALR